MAEFPFMPMYWDAYFGDTKHLTCLEHGAYLQLLGAMWSSGGVLMDDDKFLARLIGLRPNQWNRMRQTIMAFMHPVLGGRFTQRKLAYQLNIVRTKRNSAAHNAQARWLKTKALPDAFAMRPLSERYAYQTNKDSLSSDVESCTDQKQGGSPMKEASKDENKDENKDEEIIVSAALAAKYAGKRIPVPQSETVNEDGEIVVSPGLAAKYTNGGGDAA